MANKRKATDADTSPSTAISSTTVPIPKRQRVSRACDQCRAAREKCDGIQPECFPCVSQTRPCTYQTSPKKRGVQTGYIRALELLLAALFEKLPGSEDVLGTLLTTGPAFMAGSDRGADRLQKRWRKSRTHREIDRILSGGGCDTNKPSPSEEASDMEAEPVGSGDSNIPTTVRFSEFFPSVSGIAEAG
jgi:hypothetical protein